MDTKKLRQKILDLAIHGKLVPQDPNDEPASVLLERIRSEKERLIKEGKVKRSRKTTKTSDAACDKQEVPFEVPSGWVWTTIGELFQHNNGKQKTSSSQQGTLHRYITTSNVYWDCFDFSKVGEMYFSDSELDKCTAYRGDLLVCEGGDIGRAAIWNYDYTICIQNHLHRLRAYVPLYTKFFLYSLMDTKGKGLIKGKGIGLMSLSANDLHAIPTVLPPLAEQERIATEIERWFNLIDIIEQGKADLKTTIKQAKNKILELAIHGKLVPQDPNDEPASELLKRINPKAEITCDNGHYKQLPKTWSNPKIKEVFTINPKNKVLDNINAGFVPMVYIDDGYSGAFKYEKRKWNDIKAGFTHFADGDIAVAKISPCLENRKSMILEKLPNGIGAGSTELYIFRSLNVNPKYALYFFKSDSFIQQCIGTFNGVVGQQRVARRIIEEIKFPLPPLSEQLRIVTKIEELFSILNIIETELAM